MTAPIRRHLDTRPAGASTVSAVDVLADEIALALQIESNAPDSKWAAQLRRQLQEKSAAVEELAKCCDVTIKAFEALGRTNNIVAQLESHRECERALIEQKAALARCRGEGN